MTYSKAEIVSALSEKFGNFDEFWDELEWLSSRDSIFMSIHGKDVQVEVLDAKFGQEGEWASQTYVVIKVGEQFFRMKGYYRSHDGQYWGGPFEEVKPIKRIVRDFRTV